MLPRAALQVVEEQLVFTAGAADAPSHQMEAGGAGQSGAGGDGGLDAEAAALLGDPVVREVLSFWSYYRGCGYERDAMAVWVQQVGGRLWAWCHPARVQRGSLPIGSQSIAAP